MSADTSPSEECLSRKRTPTAKCWPVTADATTWPFGRNSIRSARGSRTANECSTQRSHRARSLKLRAISLSPLSFANSSERSLGKKGTASGYWGTFAGMAEFFSEVLCKSTNITKIRDSIDWPASSLMTKLEIIWALAIHTYSYISL